MWSKVQGEPPYSSVHVFPCRDTSRAPGDEDLLDIKLFDDVVAQFQLDRVAELSEVSAEDQEVRGRVHRLDVVDRAHGLLDEAGIDLLGEEMRVRDPGEPEGLGGTSFLRVGHVHGIDPRQPAVAAAAVPPSSARWMKIRRVRSTWLSGLTPGRHSVRRISRRAF